DLLGAKEREYIIRFMQDSNAQDVTEELQQVAGKDVVWVPPKGTLVKDKVPAEEKTPTQQIRGIGAGVYSPEVRREQVTTERHTVESDIGVRAVQATNQAINELRDLGPTVPFTEKLKRVDALRAELLQAREDVERRFAARLQPYRSASGFSAPGLLAPPGEPTAAPPREPTAEEKEQRLAALKGITSALMNLERYRQTIRPGN